jgi:hypothetical protein
LQTEDRHPERDGEVRVVDSLGAQPGEHLLRLFELGLAEEQDALVVQHHAPELRIGGNPQATPPLDVRERRVVPIQPVLGQAEHYPGGPDAGLERRALLERGCRLGERIGVVEQRTERPPAFGPLRIRCEGLTIDGNRLGGASRRASGLGPCGDGRGGRRGRLCGLQ